MIQIKNAEQIEGIRRSCRQLAKLFDILEAELKPGIQTLHLDSIAQEFIADIGGTPAFLGYDGFPNAVCTSINSEVIHGIPSKRELCDGDIISIDCGIILEGYYSDYAFTFPIGEVAPEIQELLKVTEASLHRGIEAAKAGNRIRDISSAIFKNAKGYGIVREFSGHGVGLQLHEEPSIPNFPNFLPSPRISAGYVLAIEPMINLGGDDINILADNWTVVTSDGSISAHFEHTILVQENSTDVLTFRE